MAPKSAENLTDKEETITSLLWSCFEEQVAATHFGKLSSGIIAGTVARA
jgi:hypothetical protein